MVEEVEKMVVVVEKGEELWEQMVEKVEKMVVAVEKGEE